MRDKMGKYQMRDKNDIIYLGRVSARKHSSRGQQEGHHQDRTPSEGKGQIKQKQKNIFRRYLKIRHE